MKKISVILTVCLILSMLPSNVFADEIEGVISEDVSVEDMNDSDGTDIESDQTVEASDGTDMASDTEGIINEGAENEESATDSEIEVGGYLTEEEMELFRQKVPYTEDEGLSALATLSFGSIVKYNIPYSIESGLDGKCIDIYGASKADGTNVQIYAYNGSNAQMFRFVQDSSGYFKILNCNSGKVLDVSGGVASENRNVWQYSANNSNAQLWNVTMEGYYFVIRSKINENYVLTVGSNSNVCIASYNGSLSQKFLITPHNNLDSITYSGLNQVYKYTGSPVYPAITVQAKHTVDVAKSQATGNPLTGGLAMPLYVMGNYRQPYGSGTISSCGCGITSFAMVATYLTGKEISPSNVVAWCGNKYWNGSGTSMYGLAVDGSAHYGFKYIGQTTSVTEAMKAIKEGKPVISLQQNGGYFTRGGHFITLRGVTETGGILVSDPNGITSSNGKVEEHVPLSPALVDKNCAMYYIFSAKDSSISFGNKQLIKSVVSSKTLENGKDYNVQYSNNTNEGQAKLTVTGIGEYSNSVNKSFNFQILNYSDVGDGIFGPSGKVEGTFFIASVLDSTKVLDIYGGSTADLANVDIYTKNDTDAQKWKITPNSDGTYAIVNAVTGKALDVCGGKTADKTNVDMYRANGTGAQKWNIVINNDQTVSLSNAVSGKMVDIYGARTANGTNVWMYSANGSRAQKFYLVPTTVNNQYEGTYIVHSAKDQSQVADVYGGSKYNQAKLQMYRSNRSNAQKFKLVYVKNGAYKIVNLNSGLVIDVKGAKADDLTPVWQYNYNASKAQLWYPVVNSDGTFTFKSALNTNQVLDAYGGKTTNGTQLQIYRSNGTAAQKWIMEEV